MGFLETNSREIEIKIRKRKKKEFTQGNASKQIVYNILVSMF